MQHARVISIRGRKPSLSPLSLSSLKPASTRNASNSPISRASSPCYTEPPTPSIQSAVNQSNRTRCPSLLASPVAYRAKLSQPPDLTGQIAHGNMYYSAHGGFGDVWMGKWQKGSELINVAIKVLRPHNEDERQKMNKRLRREIQVWKRLDHENIVPLFGTTSDFGSPSSTGMVSPWMDCGNLNVYLRATGRLSTKDHLDILCDVISGLAYLHSQSVMHGDLTGANVLIDENRRACLVDFGLSSIKAEFEGSSYWSSTVGGAIRWRAPELLPTPKNNWAPVLTNSCDVYSFGSIMLQTLTGKVPYHYLRWDISVTLDVFQGIRPRRPTKPAVVDSLWQVITSCWSEESTSRPSADDVHRLLLAFRRDHQAPSK